MTTDATHLTLGPEQGTLTVETRRTGAAARPPVGSCARKPLAYKPLKAQTHSAGAAAAS